MLELDATHTSAELRVQEALLRGGSVRKHPCVAMISVVVAMIADMVAQCC